MLKWSSNRLEELSIAIKQWALELGFQQCGITNIDLSHEQPNYQKWLEAGFHGDMHYLEQHLDKRFAANNLVPGTCRAICVRMDYLPPDTSMIKTLENRDKAYISRYALGRDYHKLVRKRLKILGNKIEEDIGQYIWRAFVDSAPILERPLAEKAGIGWRGKHSLIINKKAGSMFFLGELLVDIPLPIDQPTTKDHCARCTACLDVCPTKAFIQPGLLDASKCISYLTIELKGSIPEELRPSIGNRIFGCDDCQLICPWNRFSNFSKEQDFKPRHNLDSSELIDLFKWDEATFLKLTEGSAIRRTGYIGWLRNIAVALGNSNGGRSIERELANKLNHPSDIVREHSQWALNNLKTKIKQPARKEESPVSYHSWRKKLIKI